MVNILEGLTLLKNIEQNVKMKQKQNRLKVKRTDDTYRRFCSFCKRLTRRDKDGKCESCGN